MTVKTITEDSEVTFKMGDSFRVSYSGDFGGGTIKIQERMTNGVYVDIADTEKTEESGFIIDNFGGNEYKAVLTGSTSPEILLALKGTVLRTPE